MSAAEVRSCLEEIGLNEHAKLVQRVRVHCQSRDVAEDSVQEAYVEHAVACRWNPFCGQHQGLAR